MERTLPLTKSPPVSGNTTQRPIRQSRPVNGIRHQTSATHEELTTFTQLIVNQTHYHCPPMNDKGYLELQNINMGSEAKKIDFTSHFIRSTSIACSSDPQVFMHNMNKRQISILWFQKSAIEALKEGDLQSFTDLVNNKDVEDELDNPSFWINQGREDEDGYNLAELCVTLESKAALATLVRLGLHMDMINTDTGYSALHRAAEMGKPDLLSVILQTTNHTFDVNVRTAKRKRGITALHLAASTVSDQHLKCVKILLEQPFIEVDVRDSSWVTTPLYAAGKCRNIEAAVKLLENGANADLMVGATNKTVGDFFRTWMPEFDIDKVKVVKQRYPGENIKEKLMDIVKVSSTNDINYMKNFLEFKEVSSKLTDAENGYEEVVEAVCRKGLSDFALVLFRKGANPNNFPPNSFSYPVIDAAEEGNCDLLKVLKKSNASFTVFKIQTFETVLHSILKKPTHGKEKDYLKCLEILLDDKDENFRSDMRAIINRKDVNGNTALHYSTEKWPALVTRALLQCGANIGIKNDWGDIPITRIPPKVMEDFLNEDCLISNGKDIYHKEFELTFKYDFLAPDPSSLPDCFKPHQELEECTPLSPKKEQITQAKNHALPETESLWYMGQSKEHRHLLKHPVITSFLWFKWERIRPYFNRNMRLYLLFVYLLTWFIFITYGGSSQREIINSTFYHGYVLLLIFLVMMVIRDWYKDIQDAIRADSLANSSKNIIKPAISINSPKMILEMLAYNWIDIFMIALSSTMLGLTAHLSTLIIVLLFFISIRELLQMAVSIKRYFTSFENWIELAMIALVFVVIFNNNEENLLLNRHLGAIAIVFSWAELITLIGRHPKLLHCNVYVTMFYRVLNSFFFFLLWYSLFIVAFGLGFYIMLHSDDGGKNLNALDHEDLNPLFNRTWLSLVKTSAMFVGELEFSDIPINSDTYLGVLAYIFFLSFIFLIVVVLMNLLNGLAVNDTSDIKQKAEIYSYISRVETISYLESVLLGDPFNFLSNVPDYLSSLPSGSVLRQLYRNKFCSKIFRKIGAKRFLLFYTYLPNKELSLTPNQDSRCCVMIGDEMGKDIISAAKDIITAKLSITDNNEEMFSMKQEIIQLRSELSKLGDISKKIDLLLLARK